MEPSQEKVALHLFPGENCTLTPLPGVARVVHSKAFCTVHWQEGGRCKQSTKDTHSLPPAQILGIQSGQGTARGQLKCPRGGAEAKGGGRPPPSTDALQSSGESSPESAPGEGAAASFSSPDASDRLPPGLQDAGGQLEKTPAAAAAEGGDGPARESGPLACACGQLPDLEDELSLLDPFPRYMKSCQDLIIPEQCRCADSRPSGCPSPETLVPSSAEVADLTRARAPSPVRVPPGPEPQPSPGLQPDVCTKDLADAPAEEPQEKASPLDPPPPQGQPAVKPPKDVPASRFAQQLREEGWNLQTSESLTLAEVYLMMGKPNKLQLEYDWLAVLGPEGQALGRQAQGSRAGSPPTTFHKQRLLSCLLKLISTEVNPRLVSVGQSMALLAPQGLAAGWLGSREERPALWQVVWGPTGSLEEVVWGSPFVPWSGLHRARGWGSSSLQCRPSSHGAHTGCTLPGSRDATEPKYVGRGDRAWDRGAEVRWQPWPGAELGWERYRFLQQERRGRVCALERPSLEASGGAAWVQGVELGGAALGGLRPGDPVRRWLVGVVSGSLRGSCGGQWLPWPRERAPGQVGLATACNCPPTPAPGRPASKAHTWAGRCCNRKV